MKAITLIIASALLSIPCPAAAPFDGGARVLVGYQGWFRCPGDGSPVNQWIHWLGGPAGARHVNVDLFPDTRELAPADTCTLPGTAGEGVHVYSSFHPAVVEKHFEWMRDYGIDGALAQRFLSDLPLASAEHDRVLANVMRAAERTHRMFAVEYDLSGQAARDPLTQIEADWAHLENTLGIDRSPAYLRRRGRPVVGIWGLGFDDPSHLKDPEQARQLIRWLKDTAGVAVMGGVPSGWRSLSGDSVTDARWTAVYAELDIVQPWTVGRYGHCADVDVWQATHIRPDLERTRAAGQLYLPVIFPGFSWHNMRPASPENEIPRLGGRFLWRQAVEARASGAAAVKIAMFDEVDEGTAIYKIAATQREVPREGYWLTLDARRLRNALGWVSAGGASDRRAVSWPPGPDGATWTCFRQTSCRNRPGA